MKFLLSIVFIFGFSTISALAQTKDCRKESLQVSKAIQCANIIVQLAEIKVKNLKGIVNTSADKVLIEVYKIRKEETKQDSYNLTKNKSPYIIIETDNNNEFCIKNISQGYYILKFGTADGGWNCSWMKVSVFKNNKDRKIKASLELGI